MGWGVTWNPSWMLTTKLSNILLQQPLSNVHDRCSVNSHSIIAFSSWREPAREEFFHDVGVWQHDGVAHPILCIRSGVWGEGTEDTDESSCLVTMEIDSFEQHDGRVIWRMKQNTRPWNIIILIAFMVKKYSDKRWIPKKWWIVLKWLKV